MNKLRWEKLIWFSGTLRGGGCRFKSVCMDLLERENDYRGKRIFQSENRGKMIKKICWLDVVKNGCQKCSELIHVEVLYNSFEMVSGNGAGRNRFNTELRRIT